MWAQNSFKNLLIVKIWLEFVQVETLISFKDIYGKYILPLFNLNVPNAV